MAYVHVDMYDFDDDDLIVELESRGYVVRGKDEDELEKLPELHDVIWNYKNGRIKEAMIMLERSVPQLYGISKKVNE